MSKVTDCVEGRVPGEADSEKEICVQSFPGECSQSHSLGKQKQQQQRQESSRRAAGPRLMRPFRVGPSYGKEARASHFTLTSCWAQAATRKTAQLRASCLSSIQCNSQ